MHAQQRSREESLEAIDVLSQEKRPTRFEHDKMRLLCDDFLQRFPQDDEAANVRQRLGLACAALGEDARAARELALVTATAKAGSDFRNLTLYALAQAEIRLADAAGARATLALLVAEAPESRLSKRAKQDLDDLARLGQATPLAKLKPVAARAGVRVVALARGADPIDDLGLPRDAIPLIVAGWEDPILKDWPVPALPRVYVLDAEGRVRAAGVRGEGIAKALAQAALPWPAPK